MYIYEAHTFSDPQLPFIFHDTTQVARLKDCPHNWHENVEIVLFTSGEGFMRHNEQVIPVRAGSVAVINSNHLHAFGSEDTMEYHCLIIDRSFCLANHVDTNQIHFEHLFVDEDIACRMLRIREEYANSEPSSYRTQVIRGEILTLLGLLCRRHSHPQPEGASESHMVDCVKKAIGYIRSHYRNDISLDDVSAFAGVSKYHFAREFRRITGYTFVSFVNLTRCEAAKTLLTEGNIPVGMVGSSCGFSNQSYFTRTFLRYVGILPGAYRECYSQKS